MTSDQPKRGRGRPATGRAPSRHVRVGDIWEQAKAIAENRGETISAVVVRALTEYVNTHK